MKQAATRELYNHWNDLRGDRAAPDREEIEPASIRGLLNDTFILERGPRQPFAFRLCGARIGELFLAEMRGANFLGLFSPEDADSVHSLLEAVTDDPGPIVAGVRAAPPGRDPMDLELLLLPLGPLGMPDARVLGSLTPATRSSWFGLLACEPARLTSLRILHPATVAPSGRYPFDPALWATLPLADGRNARKLPAGRANLTLYNG